MQEEYREAKYIEVQLTNVARIQDIRGFIQACGGYVGSVGGGCVGLTLPEGTVKYLLDSPSESTQVFRVYLPDGANFLEIVDTPQGAGPGTEWEDDLTTSTIYMPWDIARAERLVQEEIG